MKNVIPCLWFANQAEDAVKFYASIFKDLKIRGKTRYGKETAKAAGRPEGSVMTIDFEFAGQGFLALNGGPIFRFSEAISFIVNCDSQAEIDRYWDKLSRGGEKGQCGWLKDKYGLSWQIVPTILGEMMQDKNAERTGSVMSALLKMRKLDIKTLKRAYGH